MSQNGTSLLSELEKLVSASIKQADYDKVTGVTESSERDEAAKEQSPQSPNAKADGGDKSQPDAGYPAKGPGKNPAVEKDYTLEDPKDPGTSSPANADKVKTDGAAKAASLLSIGKALLQEQETPAKGDTVKEAAAKAGEASSEEFLKKQAKAYGSYVADLLIKAAQGELSPEEEAAMLELAGGAPVDPTAEAAAGIEGEIPVTDETGVVDEIGSEADMDAESVAEFLASLSEGGEPGLTADADAGAMGGEEEELAQLVQALVESGEVTPEELEALLAEAGAVEGAPAEAPVVEEPPVEEVPPEEVPVEEEPPVVEDVKQAARRRKPSMKKASAEKLAKVIVAAVKAKRKG